MALSDISNEKKNTIKYNVWENVLWKREQKSRNNNNNEHKFKTDGLTDDVGWCESDAKAKSKIQAVKCKRVQFMKQQKQ